MSNTEIITDTQYLAVALDAAAETINEHIDLITQHEDSFQEATLEPRLLIGLEIVKAQEAFGMSFTEAGKLGGEAKASLSHRDKVETPASNPLGFSAWIGKNIPRLNRATAYKYATAFRSLGISSHDASAAKIRARIKDLRHHAGKNDLPMPTLNLLYKQGKPTKAEADQIPRLPNPTDDPNQRLRDAREFWFTWRESAEKHIGSGSLDDLDKKGIEELREFNLWLRDRINARLK